MEEARLQHGSSMLGVNIHEVLISEYCLVGIFSFTAHRSREVNIIGKKCDAGTSYLFGSQSK